MSPAFCCPFTARKRSLGQGNVFTPVCHSVHRGVHPSMQWVGCLPLGLRCVHPPGTTPPEHTHLWTHTTLDTPQTHFQAHTPWANTPLDIHHPGHPPRHSLPPRASEAGGMHPTGMYSCYHSGFSGAYFCCINKYVGYCRCKTSICCFSMRTHGFVVFCKIF